MFGLDLFSGIGGLTLALGDYVRPVAYCENDRYAQGVLLSRMSDGSLPRAPIWDDVRTLRPGMLGTKPDIIYGGFPCQDISIAGPGVGLEGQRSRLFFEIVRLCGDIRPRFVFLENTPAITVRGLDRVLLELASLGYDCRWTVVSAGSVGAVHLRERWFLLGYANQEQRNIQESKHTNTYSKKLWQEQTKIQREQRSLQSSWSCDKRSIARAPEGFSKPFVGRNGYGIQKRMDRIGALGNAVVPLQAKVAFDRLMFGV